MNRNPFQVNHNTYRVIGRGNGIKRFNVLQQQRKFMFWTYWKTIETEPVPEFAHYAIAFLGYTTWQSTLLRQINEKSHPIFNS